MEHRWLGIDTNYILAILVIPVVLSVWAVIRIMKNRLLDRA
jgi:hypothetical protein